MEPKSAAWDFLSKCFFTSGNYQIKYFAQIKMILQKFHEGKFQTKNKVDIKTNLQYVINLHKIKKCLFNK